MLVSASPVTVSLKSGAIGAEMVFNVTQNGIHLEDGPGEEAEYIVHYSVPPSTWWNDVKFACGTIHVFKNNTEAAAWVSARRLTAAVQWFLTWNSVTPVALSLVKRWDWRQCGNWLRYVPASG